MKSSDKTTLVASALGTVAVGVVGTTLSVLLNGFAQGFLVLGALCLAAAALVLWKPVGNRMLEEWAQTTTLSLPSADLPAYKRSVTLWVVIALMFLGLTAAVSVSLVSRDDSGGGHSVGPPAKKEAPRHDQPPKGESGKDAPLKANPPSDSTPRAPQQYAGEPKNPGYGGSGGTYSSGAAGGSPPPSDTPAARSSEADAGTSPLVPILIAIAVLAAISIAVLVLRQRRLRDRGETAEAHR